MTFRIDYEQRIQNSLRQSLREILQDVSKKGLPGNHHFYISFKSQFPGVEMSDWLVKEYPDEMTIVIQNWFEELRVSKEKFSIILNFNNSPEKMTIPLQSITNFSDPSTNFSLQFEILGDDKSKPIPEINIGMRSELQNSQEEKIVEENTKKKVSSPPPRSQKKGGNVIDFERFRKSD